MHKGVFDNQAEMAILGAIFLDNDAIHLVNQRIDVKEFYFVAHRKIFTVMNEMAKRNIPFDLVTVPDELRKQKLLDEIGGTDYLEQIVAFVPTAHNVAHYCRIVMEKAIGREIVIAATKAIERIYAGMEPISVANRLDWSLKSLQPQVRKNEGIVE